MWLAMLHQEGNRLNGLPGPFEVEHSQIASLGLTTYTTTPRMIQKEASQAQGPSPRTRQAGSPYAN